MQCLAGFPFVPRRRRLSQIFLVRLGLLLTLLLMMINLNNSATDSIPTSDLICPLILWILMSAAFVTFALAEYFLILVLLRFGNKVSITFLAIALVFTPMLKVDTEVGRERETKTKWTTGEKQRNECKEKARKYSDLFKDTFLDYTTHSEISYQDFFRRQMQEVWRRGFFSLIESLSPLSPSSTQLLWQSSFLVIGLKSPNRTCFWIYSFVSPSVSMSLVQYPLPISADCVARTQTRIRQKQRHDLNVLNICSKILSPALYRTQGYAK